MEGLIDSTYALELPRRRKINIPERVPFGLEIENNGLKNMGEIYEAERLIRNISPEFEVKDDRSLTLITTKRTIEYGFEVVTPVMHAKKKDIELLIKLSNTLKHINPKYNLSSFQINFDDNLSTSDKLYLLKLYTYYEQVIARFCRGYDDALRPGANTYSNQIYTHIIDMLDLFLNPEILFKIFNNNKMYAISFKNKYKNLIEFRLPNGTNDYTLWFNYINMYYNLLKVVKTRRLDERYLDIKLREYSKNPDMFYEKKYKCFPINETLAVEYAKLLFDNDIDRMYFLKQYMGEYKVLEKAQ